MAAVKQLIRNFWLTFTDFPCLSKVEALNYGSRSLLRINKTRSEVLWEYSMSEKNENLKQIVARAKDHVSDTLGDLWWWFMIRGVMLFLLATLAFVWPQQTVGLLVKLLGGYLLLDGFLGVIGAYRARDSRGAPVIAIAGLIVGAVLLFLTGESMRLFLVLVGVWALIQGIGMFFSGRSQESDAESRNLVCMAGGGLAIAGLILLLWPNTGIIAVSWLIAIVTLLIGCLLIFVATKLRRISKRLT